MDKEATLHPKDQAKVFQIVDVPHCNYFLFREVYLRNKFDLGLPHKLLMYHLQQYAR